MLQDKHVVLYGAGGTLGSAIGKGMAEAGARVFLTGPRREPLVLAAAAIGDAAHVAVVDARDEVAVAAHLEGLNRVDVSMNLASRGDVQGIPLLEMSVDDLMAPVDIGTRSLFVTARAAARRMVEQDDGGVVLALNSGSAKGSPRMGGTGLADGAADALIRNLASECGPAGVRACGMWVAGVPESLTVERMAAVNASITEDQVDAILAGLDAMRMTRRSPRLAEVAATAVFLASPAAAGITGSWVNVTGGMFAT